MMRIDEHGVLRFFEGGDADSAAANDAAAADAGVGDVGVGDGSGGVDLGSFADVEAAAPASGMGLDEPSNLSQADLNALSNAGLGSLQGINPNNPTQSVDEAIAANNFHSFMNVAVPAFMGFAVPGFGAITKGAQVVDAVTSGNMTIGQAVTSIGLGLTAQAIGVPPGTLNAAINGNLGQVVANTTMAAAPAVIGAVTGIPAGIVGLGMNVSGLGQQGNQAIASNVNEALGVTPSNAAIGQVAASIDEALGLEPGTAQAIGLTENDFGPAGGYTASAGDDASSSDSQGQAQVQSEAKKSSVFDEVIQAAEEAQARQRAKDYRVARTSAISPFGLMYGLDEMRG
jgi:hypothetical protein